MANPALPQISGTDFAAENNAPPSHLPHHTYYPTPIARNIVVVVRCCDCQSYLSSLTQVMVVASPPPPPPPAGLSLSDVQAGTEAPCPAPAALPNPKIEENNSLQACDELEMTVKVKEEGDASSHAQVSTSATTAPTWHNHLAHWASAVSTCTRTLTRRAFRALGLAVGARPMLTVIATVAFVVACCAGNIMLKAENDFEKLWYPRHSRAWKDKVFVRDHFGAWNRTATVYLEATTITNNNDNNNNMGSKLLQAAADVHRLTTQIPLYDDVCARKSMRCVTASVLTPFEHNATSLTWANVLNASDILPAPVDVLAAGIDTRENNAAAVRVSFELDRAKSTESLLSFEKTFLQLCRGRFSGAISENIRVACEATRSYQDEQERALEGDTMLMMGAVGVMLLYTSLAFAKPRDAVRSQSMLGLSVMITVGMALGSAFGACAFAGLPFTQLSLMSVFIIIGVGVDDTFVLHGAFERARDSDDEGAMDVASDASMEAACDAKRLARALEEAGPSVLLTSLTDAVAFSVGAAIDLPAIRYFCIVAGVAVIFVFILQTTAFAACLVLDAKRQRRRRLDVAPCIVTSKPAENDEDQSRQEDDGLLEKLLRDYYVPTLFPEPEERIAWRSIVVCLMICVMTVLLYTLGAQHIRRGANWASFLPEDSYLLEAYEVRDRHFGNVGSLMVLTGRVQNATHPKTLEAIRSLHATAVALPWLRALPAEMERGVWYEALSRGEVGATSLRTDVVRDESGDIVASRVVYTADVPMDPDEDVRRVDEARRVADDPRFSMLGARVFSAHWQWLERYRRIDQITSQTIGGALGGVALVSILLLRPSAAVFTTLSVGMCCCCLLGGMSLWGLRLNVATVVNLVLGVGFSIDYSAHIADCFATRRSVNGESRTEAVKKTLATLGPNVLHGGCSTLLAVLLLAASKSTAYQDIFKSFLLIVVFGLLNGFALLPCTLRLLG